MQHTKRSAQGDVLPAVLLGTNGLQGVGRSRGLGRKEPGSISIDRRQCSDGVTRPRRTARVRALQSGVRTSSTLSTSRASRSREALLDKTRPLPPPPSRDRRAHRQDQRVAAESQRTHTSTASRALSSPEPPRPQAQDDRVCPSCPRCRATQAGVDPQASRLKPELPMALEHRALREARTDVHTAAQAGTPHRRGVRRPVWKVGVRDRACPRTSTASRHCPESSARPRRFATAPGGGSTTAAEGADPERRGAPSAHPPRGFVGRSSSCCTSSPSSRRPAPAMTPRTSSGRQASESGSPPSLHSRPTWWCRHLFLIPARSSRARAGERRHGSRAREECLACAGRAERG